MATPAVAEEAVGDLRARRPIGRSEACRCQMRLPHAPVCATTDGCATSCQPVSAGRYASRNGRPARSRSDAEDRRLAVFRGAGIGEDRGRDYDPRVSGTETLSDKGVLERVPSPALVVGAIASVQFGSAIGATLFPQIGPGGAVLLRLLFGSAMLALIWPPRVRGHTRDELLLAALLGLVLAAMNMSFYHSIQRIPLGIAVTIEFVGPLTVAVIGSKRRIDLLWVGLAAVGIVALMRGNAQSLDTLGVILALVAGCLWGFYILVNARMGQVFAQGNGLTLAMCIATLVALPIGLGEGGNGLFHLHTLALGALVGLMSSAIPYSFELEALRRIATHVFGVLMSIEPAMAALAGLIVLGQALSARQLVGIGLVVVASVGAARRAPRAPVDV